MIIIKNHLLIGSILGIILDLISTAFKVVYRVLKVFNLQYTFIVLIVGVVLYFTGVLKQNFSLAIIMIVLLLLSLALAITLSMRTIKKMLKLDKREKSVKKQPVAIQEPSPIQVQMQSPTTTYRQQEVYSNYVQNIENINANEQPKYYRVKQNANYIMAEYSNRYELYKRTNTGLVKIRTDYKNIG